jgi:hypothetical protein
MKEIRETYFMPRVDELKELERYYERKKPSPYEITEPTSSSYSLANKKTIEFSCRALLSLRPLKQVSRNKISKIE